MEQKVSVIIPVYKVQDKILKTLECIKNQTFKQMEVLFIDDGSPDESSKVIDNYLNGTHVNYRIIKKENGGVSSARNLGILEAKGEYVQFLDGDDYMDNDTVYDLYNKANKEDSDIVYSGFVFEECDGTKIYDNISNLEDRIYTGKEAALGLIYGSSHTHIMANLFKKSLLIENNIRFDENRKYAEDIAFEIKSYAHAKKVCCVPKVNTHYIKWEGSAVNNVNINFLDMYYSNVETKEYLKEKLNDKDIDKGMAEYRIPVSIIGIFSALASSNKLQSELDEFISNKDVRRALKRIKIKEMTVDRIKYYLIGKGILFNSSLMKKYYQKRS